MVGRRCTHSISYVDMGLWGSGEGMWHFRWGCYPALLPKIEKSSFTSKIPFIFNKNRVIKGKKKINSKLKVYFEVVFSIQNLCSSICSNWKTSNLPNWINEKKILNFTICFRPLFSGGLGYICPLFKIAGKGCQGSY